MGLRPRGGVGVGGGRGGGGGIPAAIVPQAGLTDAAKRNEDWRGILVGLRREDAGVDWKLATRAGQEPVQASTNIPIEGSVLRIDLDPGLAGAAGADGNRWQVDVNPANLSSDPTSARISRANANSPVVLIAIRQAGSTYAQVAAIVNAVAGLTATLTGDGNAAFPSNVARQQFGGGLNGADVGAEYDEPTKTVTLEHTTSHTQQQIVDALNELELDGDTTLYAVLIEGSNPGAQIEAAPKSWPFSRIFSAGSLPRPTADLVNQRIAQITARANGTEIVFELDGAEVFRIPEAAVRTLLTNLGVIHV